jgi:glycosyltransferase involved in cell wall biosynthesis
MKKFPKILFVARDDGGCGYFRCLQPAKFLKRAGLADAEYILRDPTLEQLLSADLVIMQHMGTMEAANIANFCIEHKIPYMAEFDDFVHHVSPHNQSGYLAWNPSTLFVARAMDMTRRAFGITVSTPQLAKEYFPYNPTIYVVPNYLDKELWDQPILKKNDGKIRIGWMGGNAHADDLKMISKVIEKIVKEFKGKVVFETIGMTKQELHGVFPMQEFDGECPSCKYEGVLHHYPGEDLQNYPMILASKGWDIGLAPVIGNAFGNSKSDLKIKEYAAAGIPIVASPIPPYVEASNYAQIRFATTFEEWYNCIKDLILHPDKRDVMVRHNKEWAEKNWIQDNVSKIFEVYSQVLQTADVLLGKNKVVI